MGKTSALNPHESGPSTPAVAPLPWRAAADKDVIGFRVTRGQGCPRVPSLGQLRAHRFQGKRALVALLVPAHGCRALLDLAVADHEHVRDLAQLRIADLAPD